MKTTVEISDPLLREAKRVAVREGTTLRALLERGLRLAIGTPHSTKPFQLRDGRFGDPSRAREFPKWETIRDLIYEHETRNKT